MGQPTNDPVMIQQVKQPQTIDTQPTTDQPVLQQKPAFLTAEQESFAEQESASQQSFYKDYHKRWHQKASGQVVVPKQTAAQVTVHEKTLGYLDRKDMKTRALASKQSWERQFAEGTDYGFELDENPDGMAVEYMASIHRWAAIEEQKKAIITEVLGDGYANMLPQHKELMDLYGKDILALAPPILAHRSGESQLTVGPVPLEEETIREYRSYLAELMNDPVQAVKNAMMDVICSFKDISEQMLTETALASCFDTVNQVRQRLEAVSNLKDLSVPLPQEEEEEKKKEGEKKEGEEEEEKKKETKKKDSGDGNGNGDGNGDGGSNPPKNGTGGGDGSKKDDTSHDDTNDESQLKEKKTSTNGGNDDETDESKKKKKETEKPLETHDTSVTKTEKKEKEKKEGSGDDEEPNPDELEVQIETKKDPLEGMDDLVRMISSIFQKNVDKNAKPDPTDVIKTLHDNFLFADFLSKSLNSDLRYSMQHYGIRCKDNGSVLSQRKTKFSEATLKNLEKYGQKNGTSTLKMLRAAKTRARLREQGVLPGYRGIAPAYWKEEISSIRQKERSRREENPEIKQNEDHMLATCTERREQADALMKELKENKEKKGLVVEAASSLHTDLKQILEAMEIMSHEMADDQSLMRNNRLDARPELKRRLLRETQLRKQQWEDLNDRMAGYLGAMRHLVRGVPLEAAGRRILKEHVGEYFDEESLRKLRTDTPVAKNLQAAGWLEADEAERLNTVGEKLKESLRKDPLFTKEEEQSFDKWLKEPQTRAACELLTATTDGYFTLSPEAMLEKWRSVIKLPFPPSAQTEEQQKKVTEHFEEKAAEGMEKSLGECLKLLKQFAGAVKEPEAEDPEQREANAAEMMQVLGKYQALKRLMQTPSGDDTYGGRFLCRYDEKDRKVIEAGIREANVYYDLVRTSMMIYRNRRVGEMLDAEADEDLEEILSKREAEELKAMDGGILGLSTATTHEMRRRKEVTRRLEALEARKGQILERMDEELAAAKKSVADDADDKNPKPEAKKPEEKKKKKEDKDGGEGDDGGPKQEEEVKKEGDDDAPKDEPDPSDVAQTLLTSKSKVKGLAEARNKKDIPKEETALLKAKDILSQPKAKKKEEKKKEDTKKDKGLSKADKKLLDKIEQLPHGLFDDDDEEPDATQTQEKKKKKTTGPIPDKKVTDEEIEAFFSDEDEKVGSLLQDAIFSQVDLTYKDKIDQEQYTTTFRVRFAQSDITGVKLEMWQKAYLSAKFAMIGQYEKMGENEFHDLVAGELALFNKGKHNTEENATLLGHILNVVWKAHISATDSTALLSRQRALVSGLEKVETMATDENTTLDTKQAKDSFVRQEKGKSTCWAASGTLLGNYYAQKKGKKLDKPFSVDGSFAVKENLRINPLAMDQLKKNMSEETGKQDVKNIGYVQEYRDTQSFLTGDTFGNLYNMADVYLGQLDDTAVKRMRFVTAQQPGYDELEPEQKRKIANLLAQKIADELKASGAPVAMRWDQGAKHYQTIIGVENVDGVLQFICKDSLNDDPESVEHVDPTTLMEMPIEFVSLRDLTDKNGSEELEQSFGVNLTEAYNEEGDLTGYEEREKKELTTSQNMCHCLGVDYEKPEELKDPILGSMLQETLYLPKKKSAAANVAANRPDYVDVQAEVAKEKKAKKTNPEKK